MGASCAKGDTPTSDMESSKDRSKAPRSISSMQEAEIDKNKEHNVKLVFVGQTAVGKTSIIMTWTQERFPTLYEPTVFDTYHGTKNYRGAEIKLQIWDTAGHDDLGKLRPIAYTGTDCFIVCFSLVDKNSLKEACTKWIAEVKATAKDCPCVLVGTKLDLREEIEQSGDEEKIKNCVSTEDMKQWAADYSFSATMECSAKEKKGLNAVFLCAFKSVFTYRQIKEEENRR